MPQVTLIADDGTTTALDIPAGHSVMQDAVARGVHGIVGRVRRLGDVRDLPRLRRRGLDRQAALAARYRARDARVHRERTSARKGRLSCQLRSPMR